MITSDNNSWQSQSYNQGQGQLLLVSHGAQVLAPATHPQVKTYVEKSRLSALATMWYPVTNKDLMNFIFERWHQETSSFHLPVGEMSITLDDMSCLLHLPLIGRSIDHVSLHFDKKVVRILLMTYLGILTETEATIATNAGAKVRLTWLEDLYHRYVKSNSYV
ncbi:Protein MAIN-LIKE 2 [Glycine max]|nr:Protein MAIN-LIKE 2 [Glycine max]